MKKTLEIIRLIASAIVAAITTILTSCINPYFN